MAQRRDSQLSPWCKQGQPQSVLGGEGFGEGVGDEQRLVLVLILDTARADFGLAPGQPSLLPKIVAR